MNYRTLAIAAALVAFGVVARLLPHVPNVTPLTALAFTGGIYLGKRWAILIPILTLALSDVVIGMYDWRIMTSVYGSFALIGLLSWLFRERRGVVSAAIGISTASILFFLITNAAVWAFSPWYEKSIFGLLYAYELGLPFLRFMMGGDILYAAVLFGAFELAASFTRRAAQRRAARQHMQYAFRNRDTGVA